MSVLFNFFKISTFITYAYVTEGVQEAKNHNKELYNLTQLH